MAVQDSTPGDGYVLNGKPYIFIDTKGTAAPAMRDPQTNEWVADQRAMARAGMKQVGSAVASPEDDAALKAMVAALPQKQTLATGAQQFMNAEGATPTGPRYGALPVMGGDLQTGLRKNLARSDPALESKLEQMEAINSQNWALMRPPNSGRILDVEARAWKNAFPTIQNMGPANAAIAKRLQDEYADKSNEADFVQNYVHTGQGGYPAGTAAFANTKRTPNAAGRTQSLGAAPGDFSGQTPGWSQQLPSKQLAAAKLYANANAAPGSKGNPYVPRSRDSVSRLPRGSWFVDDDGTLNPVP